MTQFPQPSSDLLRIALSAAGYPAFVRLSMPDPFERQPAKHFALILARTETLTSHRAMDRDTKFPNPKRLHDVREILRAGQPMQTPVLELYPDVPAQQFSINDGRHRILVLAELRVPRIPVVVPWQRADDLLGYLG